MLEQFNIWMKYLFSKRSEVAQMDYRDALLAQVNIRIYRTAVKKSYQMVPLDKIKYLHKLERGTAQETLMKRKKEVVKHKQEILSKKRLTNEELNTYLPSVSSIHLVQDRGGDYIAFEGNGRIAALKEVLGKDKIDIEAEEYVCKSPRKILYMLHRIRKLNGLFQEEGV